MKEKKGADGKVTMRYFTGTLYLGVHGEVQIAVFKADKKTSDKAPDYNIVLSKSSPEREPGDEDDSDIPF